LGAWFNKEVGIQQKQSGSVSDRLNIHQQKEKLP